MTKTESTRQNDISWENLLAAISDEDLDLLISVNDKMQRGETALSSSELEAYLRWYPQIDTWLTGPSLAS